MRGVCRSLLVSLTGAVIIATGAGAQERRPAIVGRVTERGTDAPIMDANVVVVGTQRGARTDRTGAYRIADVDPGSYTLRVMRLGYAASTRIINVTATNDVTADFVLQTSAVEIDQVVVTATGATERKRENGNDVGIIKPGETISLAAQPNLTSTLAAKTPGLTITQSMGTAGSSARIRIRGANSVSLSNEPLLIVDGVKMDNSTSALSGAISPGGAQISRFDDINPDDIETIEVLKGPAASALYGTAAANGVIQVTTKRGRVGRTQLRVFSQYGTQIDPTDYPSNYYNVGTRPNGTTATFSCTMDRAFQGLCKQGDLKSFNPEKFYDVFQTGNMKSGGLSLFGGGDAAQYFVSGDLDRQVGAVPVNRTHNYSLRANLTTRLSQKLNATFTTNYVDRDVRLPDNDNDIYGPLGNILLGRAFNCSADAFHAGTLPAQCGTDTLSRGFYSALPSTFYIRQQRQYAKRFVGGATATWQPTSWLTGVGQAGMDVNNVFDTQYFPSNVVTWVNATLRDGAITEYRRQTPGYTAQGSFTATHTFLSNLAAQTVVGAAYQNEQTHYTLASATQLISNTQSLSAATANKTVGEDNQTIITVGGYGREQLAWKDRAFLTASLRADENSAFGKNFKLAYYPAVSASWVLSEEPFIQRMSAVGNGHISQVRLRASYGQSGQRPSFRQADTYLSAAAIVQGASELAAAIIGGTGNPNLKPEISTEYEVGFDASFLQNRIGVNYTHFSKTTRDALIARVLAPSLGVSTTQYVNLGRVFNGGNEYSINATALDNRNVKFELTLAGSTLDNKLEQLGKDIAPIVFSPQQHREGYPLGGYWTQQILSYNDANNDHVLTRSEINVTDTMAYRGPVLPTFELSLTPTLTVRRNLRVAALFQRRGGNYVYNQTEEFRCTTSAFSNCRAVNDPTASLEDQAAVIAYLKSFSHWGFIQKGDFTKLRELSASYALPAPVANRLGFRDASVTLAGRNLAKWTDYKGFDPEVNSQQNANFGLSDFLTQAPFRQFVARVDVTF
jgi:TonB-dependent starch-binding outer membrane protein SusC